jgi:hypothetical protein
MPILLGLTGKAGSGKDSVGLVLREEHEFSRLAFADPLKEVCAALFGISLDRFHIPSLKEKRVPAWGLSPRQMLQVVGTDMVRRYLGNDFWIKRMRYDLEGWLGYDNIVITDVRFEDEAAFVRSLGGIVVHVKRPGAGLDGEAGAHVSEAGVMFNAADLILSNDGSLEDLPGKVAQLLAVAREGVPA